MVKFNSHVFKILFPQIVYPMCKYFVFLYHVIHPSFCMCVFEMSFGNVTFALMTPKTIRGCVTWSPLRFCRTNNALVQLTVDLITSIKVQFK